MKQRTLIYTLAMVLLFAPAPLGAESYSIEGRPYIGLELDGARLPDLLIKHLNLSADQGVRIANVHRDSPADKAGIERDDIIIVFQGKPVTYCEQVAEAVREAAVGTEVSLEIIHLGQRRSVKVTLERLPDEFDWRYPPEPEMMQSWQPGKFFRLGPDDKSWVQIPFDLDNTSADSVTLNLLNVLRGVYSYQYSKGDDSYTVTIEGNPHDDDTKVTVQVSKPDYKTTVKDIDDLPRKYRGSAKEALKHARKAHEKRQTWQFSAPGWSQPDAWKHFYDSDAWKRFYQNRDWPFPPQPPPLGPDDRVLDRLEKQMRELQQRLEQLEKRQKEMPGRHP